MKKKTTPTFTPPTITTDGLMMSAGLAAAMLDWASQDPTRFHLTGFGLSSHAGELWIAATDGHRLVRVVVEGVGLPCFSNAVWAAEIIDRAVKLAKVDKAPTITLPWDAVMAGAQFPATQQVVPAPGFEVAREGEFVALNPAYLLDAAQLGVAIGKLHLHKCTVAIRSVNGKLCPVRFDVVTVEDNAQVIAEMVIMPMRTGEIATKAPALKAVA